MTKKNCLEIAVISILSSLIFSQTVLAATTCSDKVMADLREKATEEKKSIRINCHPTLKSGDLITKQVVIDGAGANGVIFDCQGGTIQREGDSIAIRSRRVTDAQGRVTWSRPENVVVRNCHVQGAIRVSGMDVNGNGQANDGALKISSRQDEKHTARAQAAAPTNILLDKITITGKGRIPLYISPGVTKLTLRNSLLNGSSSSVAIYLDAESANNIIQNNKIIVDTEKREVLAIDGSRGNLIIGNHFSGLENGGIYVYRNCGEGGTVRHQKPTDNHIINNAFFYRKYDGGNPSVWLASRNGGKPYCDDDRGYPFGSSASNNDFATHNVIAENQIYRLSPSSMIRLGASPNVSIGNQTVDDEVKRPSSCYISQSEELIRSGSKKKVRSSNGCSELTCTDGVLTAAAASCQGGGGGDGGSDSGAVIVDFECTQRNSSECQKTVSCPAGYSVRDAKAVCNLETDFVSDLAVQGALWNTVSISRASERTSDGRCTVQGVSLSEGRKDLNLRGLQKVQISCEESLDENYSLGDCEVRGQLKCVRN